MLFSLLGLGLFAPAAGATSPEGCKGAGALYFCFQIIGPNHTDKVNYFEGSLTNEQNRGFVGVIEVKGPSGIWAQVVSAGSWTFIDWGIQLPAYPKPPIGQYVYPGNYCADIQQTIQARPLITICWQVRPG